MADHVFSWLVDASHHIDLIAQHLHDRHRYNRIGNVFCQPFRKIDTNLLDCAIFGLDIPHKGKRKHSIWTNHNLFGELLVLPHGN